MTSTEATWRKDFANACSLVEPFAVTFEDGFVGLVDCPAEPERIYSMLVSIGYAKGWL